jgi:4-diphosphocytidyl-2-C-methyl-D-erythritol kinase
VAGPARLVERAGPKINLSLLTLARRADGMHDLESLVAFGGGGDLVALEPGAPLALDIAGPTAGAAGAGDDNLCLKAARALEARVPGLTTGRLTLTKRLPVAAGLGGGSADAAATLRLLARANALALDDPRLIAAAQACGADVPVCVAARARMMSGVGHALGPILRLPPLYAVLANPGVALATKDVFAKLGLKPGERHALQPHPAVASGLDAQALLALLRKTRNDLEDPACVLAPVIGDVLAVLGAARGAKIARMSGSGATCFALFTDRRLAAKAARAIRRDHAGWTVWASALR